ncbi:hypothetical protein ITX31_12045 [Arthrobacter gandavensis]|uniref:hypothetical protein n=1 Tax=Arthrobacter gandavensis TaxID=169960 RepID=UPI00188DC717|nr:hypothetical protein [Arthrobacter gandavensis]MBF4994838.1 hypothetical protein [Arthrobacter gandavensis]
MTEREPDRNESTDEATWLDLVARLQETPETDPRQPSPDQPAPDDSTQAPGPGAPPAGPRSAADRTRAIFENQPLRASPQPPSGPRDYSPDEEDGSFVPEEPPPLGSGEPLVILAWLGAAGGPLLLLLFAMFWRGAPMPVVLGVVAIFVTCAGYLLFRLPQSRDEGDDGAAV